MHPYIPIVIFFVLSFGLAAALVLLSRWVGPKRPSPAKNSPYECGFDPLMPRSNSVDIRFYRLALLFIIFDLEIAFLFPWAISLKSIGWPGFFAVMAFLSLLILGLVYEWKKGALDWD